MKIHYRLDINSDSTQETYDSISRLLGKMPSESKLIIQSQDIFKTWSYEEVSNEKDHYVDYFGIFLNILDGKYENLKKLGIERSDITFWLLYEYNNQCNLEFSADEIKRIGEEGIGICISCWEGGR